MDKIAEKLKIQNPSDWGKITKRKICELGGSSILKYYNNSLFACLKSLYTGFFVLLFINHLDIEWKKDWFSNIPHFPQSYWKSMENRKKYMDELAVKLNISHPSDWGNVSIQRIYELGGGSFLKLYYNDSLLACLQSIYKGSFPLASIHI